MAALASATSSGVKTPRTIKNPLRSKRYRSASVISIGYSILRAEVEVSVALFSGVIAVLLSVDWSLVVERLVAATVTELESARTTLAAVDVDVVETMARLLLEDTKAKARTAGVSWRLAEQNIQKNMEMFRVTTSAEDGNDDGIQF